MAFSSVTQARIFTAAAGSEGVYLFSAGGGVSQPLVVESFANAEPGFSRRCFPDFQMNRAGRLERLFNSRVRSFQNASSRSHVLRNQCPISENGVT